MSDKNKLILILVVSCILIVLINIALSISREASHNQTLELKLTQAALNMFSIQSVFVGDTLETVITNKDFTIGKVDLLSLDQIFNMENPLPDEYNRFSVEVIARVIVGIESSQSLETRGKYVGILINIKDELTDIETYLDFLSTGDAQFSNGSDHFVALREAKNYTFLVDESTIEYEKFENYMKTLNEKYTEIINAEVNE